MKTYPIFVPDAYAVFFRVKEEHGGCSNMAGGYPMVIHGNLIRSSEALYQCGHFPHLPEIQKRILDQKSPMAAKMVTKPYRDQTVDGFDEFKISWMDWCLRQKLYHNWDKFGQVLRDTGNKVIVEKSRKDQFWGAMEQLDGTLKGDNTLGLLLTHLRDELLFLKKGDLNQKCPINNMLLLGFEL